MGTKSEVLHTAAKDIGKDAKLTLKNGLIVLVRVLNVEVLYGDVHYTVTPVAGEGQSRVRDNIEVIRT